MKNRFFNLAIVTLISIAFWWLIVIFEFVPDYILPSPAIVAVKIVEGLLESEFRNHVFYTLSTVVVGLLLGFFVGFVVGVLCGLSTRLSSFLMPVVVGFQSVPLVAFAPLLLLVFGQSFYSRTFVVALVVCFPILAGTAKGFAKESKTLSRLFLSIGASKTQTWFKLRLPLSIPHVSTGLKTAVPLAWVGALVAEFLGTNKGLGFLLQSSSAIFDTPMVFAVVTLLAGLGILSYVGVEILEETWLKSFCFDVS